VLDSYICLVHLLAGIVWEGLFNAFATISFTTLILFSILEVGSRPWRCLLHGFFSVDV
jgi:hypothetical protein